MDRPSWLIEEVAGPNLELQLFGALDPNRLEKPS